MKRIKIISLLMALIMFTSVFTLIIYNEEVSAALRYNFIRADEKTLASGNIREWLVPGASTPNPTIVTEGEVPVGSATVKWNMLSANGAPLTSGEFMLEYPLSDGIVARLYVVKTSADYSVTYKLFSVTGSPAVYTPLAFDKAVNDYMINSGAGYINTESFPNSEHYRAERESGVNSVPMFTVEPGQGITLKYKYDAIDNKEVIISFRSELSGDFRFTTSGIKEGAIYDFGLSLKEGGNFSNKETISIMKGLIKSSFLSVAKANVDGNIVDERTAVDLRTGETAKAENRVNISIMLPELWDSASHSFVTIDKLYNLAVGGGATPAAAEISSKAAYKAIALSHGYGELQAQFRLTDAYGKIYIVKIANLFDEANTSNSVEPTDVFFRPDGTKITPYINASLGRIYIEIGPLPANVIFNRVDIYVNSYVGGLANERFSCTPCEIDSKGVVYTFLNYKIVTIHGKYYIELTPYKQMENGVLRGSDGMYSLYDVNGLISQAEATKNTVDKIMLPTNIGEGIGYNIQYYIVFTPTKAEGKSQVYVRSQEGKYTTTAQDIAIDTPEDFKIVKYTLTLRDEITHPAPLQWENLGDLSIDMSWDIATPETLQTLLPAVGNTVTIKYLINSTNMPVGYTDSYKSVPAASVNVTVERMAANDSAYPLGFKISYAQGDEPTDFTLVAVPASEVPSEYISTNKMMRAYVRFDFVAAAKGTAYTIPTFEYPNIYFLNVRPSEIGYNGAVLTDYPAPASLYDSLTLNDISELQVPPPQNLKITDNTYIKDTADPTNNEISMVVNWSVPHSQIESYLETMPKYPSNLIGSDIYIAHDQATLKKFQADLELLEASAEKQTFLDENIYVFDSSAAKLSEIDFSAETAELVSTGDTKKIIDALRDGKIVAIRNIPHSMTADTAMLQKVIGLDKNQRYFYTMGLTVTFVKEPARRVEFSTLIGMVGETTLADPQVPDPLDKLPSAPVFILPVEKGSNNALIKWMPVIEPPITGRTVEIGYEIVRIKDAQLKTADGTPDLAILNTRTKFSDFYTKITNSEKIGIELLPDGSYHLIPVSGSPVVPTDFTLTYSAAGAPVILEDNSLTPNNIYFYYVRTYKTIDGNTANKVYSTWSNISVTTNPVAAPENLVYERDRSDFDMQTEAILSFDAPVYDQTLDTANNTLGGYKFQYQIRLENGVWSEPKDMSAQYLSQNNTPLEKSGYRHYFYKLTGLESGKTYSVRVRIVDANDDASAYTNIAEIRTKLNQDDYDDEILTGDWLAYLEEKLQDVIKENWWSAASNQDLYVQFRPSTFPAILSQSMNSGLKFVTPATGKTEYIIPAASFKLASSGSKSFIIEGNGLQIVVPASAIDQNSDAGILKINERIKAKALADYYIKVTVTYATQYETVNGNTPLSKKASISFDAVGSLKETTIIDNEIYNALVALVAKKTESDTMKAELKKLINAGTSNEELVKYIDKIVADSKAEFQTTFTKMRLANIKESYTITNLLKNVQIKFTQADSTMAVKGFKAASALWVEQSLTNSGTAKVISTNQTGSFVFAGASISSLKLDAINGVEDAASIIIKYGLTDIFTSGTDMTRAATGYEFASAVARISGAKNTDDPFDYLKGKGITISTLKSQSGISKQEAIYLTTGLYEIKTGKKISSIAITNFNQTSGIKNIDSKYLKAIQVGFQLGIYTDKSMVPKSAASLNDMLQMLVNLNKKVKL